MTNPLKQRQAVASITGALEDVHTSIDRAIAGGATLMVKTMTAREQIGVSGVVAQDEIEAMHIDLGILCQVRRRLIDRHAQMADLGRHLGLTITADGGLTKGPHGMIEADEAQAA